MEACCSYTVQQNTCFFLRLSKNLLAETFNTKEAVTKLINDNWIMWL